MSSEHDRPELPNDSPVSHLEDHGEFIRRHIGPDDADIEHMLSVLGLDSLDALVEETVPASIRLREPLDLLPPQNEHEALERLRAIAGRNVLRHSMIGMGYHDTITPAVIRRNILENPGWYTAYTPYQAEISQGRLEAMLTFQQMVCDLTAMEIANASLLDEATAAAEAMAMLKRLNRKSRSMRFLVDEGVFPQTLDVIRTRGESFGFEVVVGNAAAELPGGDFFGVLLQYTRSDGGIADIEPVIRQAHEQGILAAVATDLLALALLKPPGEMSADIVLGSAQRFGVPMGFGGPHAAFFATRDDFKRALPGRIIGVSRDRHGRPALRMALQTREQHIRRDHATSNICTSQALLAVMAAMYAVYHGAEGLRRIARRIHRLTGVLAAGLGPLGFEPVNHDFFDTLSFALPEEQADAILARAEAAGINLCHSPEGLRISVNEKTNRTYISTLWEAFAGSAGLTGFVATDEALAEDWSAIPERFRRQSSFLEHPVFSRYRSETEMMRYLKRLENRDLSLTHAMISLGSCTMKLNASSEMLPVSWPEFAQMHPFAPPEQAEGYHQLFRELEAMLIACTGYEAVS
ncbi:MAG: glycine dehydrogenase (aminomethyl-transferring), partial [Lysobacterales bacterium]